MSEQKHTPGPWKWVYRNGLFGADDVLVAAIALEFQTSEANAHLIAAAPELLEVCRKLASGGVDVSGSAIIVGYPDAWQLMDAARAAIKKAEGRS